MSEIRENRLTGEWVIIAPERAKRGGNLASATERVVPPLLASCMFCPGNEAATADERFRLDGEDGRWVLRSDQPVGTLPALAEVLHTVLAKVHGMPANPPFNLVVRSLGPQEKDAAHFHWYISIVSQVKKTAGFELGTGMYINPSSQESCAQALWEFGGEFQ